MTAFHAAVKSGQILLWTSQKKDRKKMTSRGQKVKSLNYHSWISLHFIFAFSFCYRGFEFMHIKMNSALLAKVTFCKITTAIQEKTLAGVMVAFRQKAYK